MKEVLEKRNRRLRRKKSIRKKISGTGERPRFSVYKSNKYIYAQVIDDNKGITIASASNNEKDNRDKKRTVADAEKIGEIIGSRLKEKKVKSVVFDRNGYLYHGVIKAVAEGARKAGIKV